MQRRTCYTANNTATSAQHQHVNTNIHPVNSTPTPPPHVLMKPLRQHNSQCYIYIYIYLAATPHRTKGPCGLQTRLDMSLTLFSFCSSHFVTKTLMRTNLMSVCQCNSAPHTRLKGSPQLPVLTHTSRCMYPTMSPWLPFGLHCFAVPITVTVTVSPYQPMHFNLLHHLPAGDPVRSAAAAPKRSCSAIKLYPCSPFPPS